MTLDGYLDLTSSGIDAVGNWQSAQRFPKYPSIKHLLLRQPPKCSSAPS
jgi:hypothetical protein